MEAGSQPPFDPGPQSPAPQSGPQSPAQPPAGTNVPPGGWNQPMPQSGPGQWRFASWGSRALATIVDMLVLLVPTIAIAAILIGIATTGDDSGLVAAIIGAVATVLALTLVALLYAPLLMKRPGERNGQTLGKQMTGIRVVRADGRPMDFGTGALREVVLKYLAVGIASSIIPFIPWLLDILWPLWDDQSRSLHDLGASTRVVRA